MFVLFVSVSYDAYDTGLIFLSVKILVLWVMTLCRLVYGSYHFGGACHLFLWVRPQRVIHAEKTGYCIELEQDWSLGVACHWEL